jgi:hypothetical protein
VPGTQAYSELGENLGDRNSDQRVIAVLDPIKKESTYIALPARS